jgi:dTMP kinase
MFITFEGIEGSGKTTQAARLVERLRAEGFATQRTHEPGGTPLADAVRALLLHPEQVLRALEDTAILPARELLDVAASPEEMLPETELFLFSAARAQHVARIRAWLVAGEQVVCDRFADATLAYQGYGRGLDLDTIRVLERVATHGLRPDVTFLLNLPAEESQRRKYPALVRSTGQLSLFDPDAGGEWNRLDKEQLRFHKRVHKGYLALAEAEPARWTVLDATAPPDELAERIWAEVARRLKAA